MLLPNEAFPQTRPPVAPTSIVKRWATLNETPAERTALVGQI
jgi:hypothetical protein